MIDMTGARCGSLTVLQRADPRKPDDPRAPSRWRCLCDCGAVVERDGPALRRAQNHACPACIAREQRARFTPVQRRGSAAPRKRGRPAVEVPCLACGLIGQGRRWLTAHRAESPECNRRKLAGVRRWGIRVRRPQNSY